MWPSCEQDCPSSRSHARPSRADPTRTTTREQKLSRVKVRGHLGFIPRILQKVEKTSPTTVDFVSLKFHTAFHPLGDVNQTKRSHHDRRGSFRHVHASAKHYQRSNYLMRVSAYS